PAHRLGPAGKDDLRLTQRDQLGRLGDGLQPRGTVAANGMRNPIPRHAGQDGNDPRYVAGLGWRRDVAEDGLIHLFAAHIGTVKRRDGGVLSENVSWHLCQCTKRLDKGSPGPIEDGDVEHGSLRTGVESDASLLSFYAQGVPTRWRLEAGKVLAPRMSACS